jgi:hypothetical protein
MFAEKAKKRKSGCAEWTASGVRNMACLTPMRAATGNRIQIKFSKHTFNGFFINLMQRE